MGQLTMRTMDIADMREELETYARVSLRALSTGDRPGLEAAGPCGMTVRARLAAAFRSRRFVFCLVVGVAALASWVPRAGGPIDLRWDGGAYYILGTSLAEGDGYRMRSEPGGLPSSLHPPLVPAFVALHELALQTTDPVVVGRALRLSLALCSAAYAIAVFLLVSASLPLALAVGVTLIAVRAAAVRLLLRHPLYGRAVRPPHGRSSSSCGNGAATRSGSPFAPFARSSPTRQGPRASPCSQPGWSTTRSARKPGARSSRSPSRPSRWRAGTAGSRRSKSSPEYERPA